MLFSISYQWDCFLTLFLPPNILSQPRGVVGRQVAKGGSLSRHPPQLAWGEGWP